MADAWLNALRDHDERVGKLDAEIWIGGEPTFSRRESIEACWTIAAVGGDKEERARALILELAPRLASRFELGRAPGRSYPGENEPRFAYGMQWAREDSIGAAPQKTRRNGGTKPVDAKRLEQEREVPEPERNVAWMTVTPDPGVVEVNLAPCPSIETFWHTMRATYAAAEQVGLSPFRYLFHGRIVDSGGGGQLSFGGPTPEQSPFFVVPWLLPGLVRYLNHHPSLSYWFAPECVGSAGQGPRPDEGVRELFSELGVALDVLGAREDQFSKSELMASLGPLLVDCSGNSHRAELNVEKLWDPDHPRNGLLGVAELRALRMPRTPQHATAVAMLFRAVLARIAASRFDAPLRDHGAELHDRYALPSVLLEDLNAVLSDLHAHGFGLDASIEALLREPRAVVGSWDIGAAKLRLARGMEFWPLLGDVASQEGSTARNVDASTSCVEVCVDAGEVWANGHPVPLHPLGKQRVGGVRFRSYVPARGLHPGLAASEPLQLEWRVGNDKVAIAWHAWIPGGGSYEGLPKDAADAETRREQRLILERSAPAPDAAKARDSAADAGTSWVLDLRRLPPAPG